MKPTRAVITGASSGIGESFARLLAERGTNLIIVARRADRLEKLAAELKQKHGIQVECLALDLMAPHAAKTLFEFSTKNGQIVDLLINNAGAGPYAPFLKTSLEKHMGVVQLNLVSLTELCHLFASHMLSHQKPAFISNIASVASYQGVPRFAVYSASKSYVRVFSEILNRELRGTSVSVTCVCPGGTATEFLEKNGQILKNEKFSPLMSSEKVAKISLQGIFTKKSIVIPGFLNKIACFFPRFLPSSLALTLASKAMEASVNEQQI